MLAISCEVKNQGTKFYIAFYIPLLELCKKKVSGKIVLVYEYIYIKFPVSKIEYFNMYFSISAMYRLRKSS